MDKKQRNREYYERNKERILAGYRKKYQENPEPNKLRARKHYNENREKISEHNKTLRKQGLAWSQRNPEKIRKKNQKRWRKRRIEAFEALGGEICVRCGFTDYRALQIDHVNGGGRKHTRGFTAIEKYYEYIKEHIEEFQVLCANCNRIKVYLNDETRKKELPTTNE